jgi:hypothetical protein
VAMHTPKSARTAEMSSLAIVPLQWTATRPTAIKYVNNTAGYTGRRCRWQRYNRG